MLAINVAPVGGGSRTWPKSSRGEGLGRDRSGSGVLSYTELAACVSDSNSIDLTLCWIVVRRSA